MAGYGNRRLTKGESSLGVKQGTTESSVRRQRRERGGGNSLAGGRERSSHSHLPEGEFFDKGHRKYSQTMTNSLEENEAQPR